MSDFVTFGETSLRLSPPADRQIETASRLTVGVSGPESNAAVAARRLGVETAWISHLPDTPLGRRVAAELQSYDLDVRVTWTDEGRQGLTFLEHAGGPRGDQRIDDRRDAVVTGVDEDDLPLATIRDASGVYVTGATTGLSTPLAAASARFLKEASDAGALTAFGLRYRPDLWSAAEAHQTLTELFPAVDVFVADEDDVATILDRDGQPATVAHGLASKWGFETVALFREKTSIVWQDATVHEYPVVETETVDESGDTDAFAGALVARLLDGAEPAAALKYAMATAALARTIPGAVPTVTRDQVERVAAGISKSDSQ